jgi:hypothetical protein
MAMANEFRATVTALLVRGLAPFPVSVSMDLSWDELSGLAGQLRRAVDAGAFAGLGIVAQQSGYALSPHTMARITLGDIDHVNRSTGNAPETERDYAAARRWKLATDALTLLKLAESREGSTVAGYGASRITGLTPPPL